MKDYQRSAEIREIADSLRRGYSSSNRLNRLGKIVLLIGAGCSKSAGIPLASEIAKELVCDLASDYGSHSECGGDPHAAVIKLLDSGRFSRERIYTDAGEVDWSLVYDEIFSKHYSSPKEIKKIFSEIFSRNEEVINWTHICIGELVRLGYVTTIITTNFDQLALEGIVRTGTIPVVAEGIEALGRITGDSDRPQLIQIHGSRHTYYLRNTQEDLDLVSIDMGARHVIDEIFRTATTFIVIGYGGRERGIMNALSESAARYPDTRLYWVSHTGSEAGIGPLVQKFLSTSRFSKILYGHDSDDFFQELLECLKISPPKLLSDPLYLVREVSEKIRFHHNENIRKILFENESLVYDLGLASRNIGALTPRSTIEVNEVKPKIEIESFAGAIARDFGNVLTAIIGFSDLLLSSHRSSDPAFQDIMNIKQNANRAAALVRQLLAFSRRQTLRPEVVQFGDTLADLHMLLGRLLGEKVGLEVVHGRDLWPVKADTSQLEQVIVNLAVNARDAMPSGGKLTIATRNVGAEEKLPYPTMGMPSADYVLIEVTDTGTGIPKDIIENIFEPFFTTKPVGQGTGLGLSTVYGIVKQTGGFVYCDSEMGKGTTFRIFLPRHVETVDASKPGEPAGPVAQPAAVTDLTGSATILLVEDEEAVRAFASRALASRGYTVHEAGTGQEALEVMEEVGGDIDLVVSDVVMPEMDGPSLLRELRKKRPDLKIIFVSGYAEDAFARNLPEGESFSFLPKPFTLKALATAVKEALGR